MKAHFKERGRSTWGNPLPHPQYRDPFCTLGFSKSEAWKLMTLLYRGARLRDPEMPDELLKFYVTLRKKLKRGLKASEGER